MMLDSMTTNGNFFQRLVGFPESSYIGTQEKLLGMARFQSEPLPFYYRERCDFVRHKNDDDDDDDADLIATAGIFSVPSVAELHQQVQLVLDGMDEKILQQWQMSSAATTDSSDAAGLVHIQNMVGEARSLHGLPEYENAVFQAASQFNLLEMPGPSVTPEAGIGGYEYDHTQGPACAMACAAGTAYRNYLVPMPFAPDTSLSSSSSSSSSSNDSRSRGQKKDHQINTLQDMELHLQERHGIEKAWKVRNGYVESSSQRIGPLNALLKDNTFVAAQLTQRLRIGVQEQCQVTDTDLAKKNETPTLVTQTYNAAISIGYSRLATQTWEPLARIVLNGTYEATLLVGVLETLLRPGKKRDRQQQQQQQRFFRHRLPFYSPWWEAASFATSTLGLYMPWRGPSTRWQRNTAVCPWTCGLFIFSPYCPNTGCWKELILVVVVEVDKKRRICNLHRRKGPLQLLHMIILLDAWLVLY